MSDDDRRCACGAAMQTVEITLHRRYRCPDCEVVDAASDRYELDKGDVPPDLTPLRSAARQTMSDNETVELRGEARAASPGETAASEVVEPLPVDSGPSLLNEIKSGLGKVRQRLGGGGAEDESETGQDTPTSQRITRQLEELDEDERQTLPAGTVLGGKFRIVEPLGSGGMGTVYKAQDTSLERYVALKVLSPELCRNKQFMERFVREAKAVAQLTHPNITTIYQYTKGDVFFAMEYVPGINFADRVKEDGPVALDVALEVARQTARGLKAAAARRIIHRDIKPSNLLVTGEGQIKITDFGLAKAWASVGHTLDLTSTGVVMGTPLFMSPEQGRGGTVDHRSDVYSLGATLYFLLFGRPPFEADSPIAIILKHINDPVAFPERPTVSQGVKALVLRMMAKDLDRRFADYDALITAIDKVERGESLEEESPRKVIVLSPRPSTAKRSLFKVGKLSVARTNLKLGRRGKAMSLLSEALEDGDPGLRAEAARLMLEIHEAEDDPAGVRRMAEAILDVSRDPSMTAYAGWKLAELDEKAALADLQRAIARYERILEEAPDELPRTVIEAQVRRLKSQLSAVEREAGTTQVVLGGSRTSS